MFPFMQNKFTVKVECRLDDQAISNTRNVALGKPITASECQTGCKLQHLVDGLSGNRYFHQCLWSFVWLKR